MDRVGELVDPQPEGTEIKIVPGLFVKQMGPLKRGWVVPQHSHTHAHLSMLAVGSVHVWKDGKSLGVFHAPCGIAIDAGAKHTFGVLEDGTLVYCIHRVGPGGEPEILEEHQLAEGGT